MATILVIHDDKIRQWLTSTKTTGEGHIYVYGQRDRSTGWLVWPLVPAKDLTWQQEADSQAS